MLHFDTQISFCLFRGCSSSVDPDLDHNIALRGIVVARLVLHCYKLPPLIALCSKPCPDLYKRGVFFSSIDAASERDCSYLVASQDAVVIVRLECTVKKRALRNCKDHE